MAKFNAKDLTGKRFGRLTAIEPIGRAKQGNVIWRCKCDCGNEKNVSTKELGRGTSSCGCLARELSASRVTKHGKSRSRIYNVHKSMMMRCYHPNAHEYENYGGRGITVCDEWHDFERFYEWAVQNGYDENSKKQSECTLDRVDHNGNYEPSNCRWVSMKTQQRNRRNNVLITYNGETHCMSEWAEIAGLKYVTFCHRLKAGWSMEDAMNKPLVYTR